MKNIFTALSIFFSYTASAGEGSISVTKFIKVAEEALNQHALTESDTIKSISVAEDVDMGENVEAFVVRATDRSGGCFQQTATVVELGNDKVNVSFSRMPRAKCQ